MADMLRRVVVFGDALYSLGIVNAVRDSGVVGNVDAHPLNEPLADEGIVDGGIVIVCADDGDIMLADGVVRRIARRNRSSRIVMVTNLTWEDRLDRVSQRTVNACLPISIARDQLLRVLFLAAEGFCIL